MVWKRRQESGHGQVSFRHHYIPEFFLNRWRDSEKQIFEYSRPYKNIQCKRVFPKQTGFLDRLYEMKGVSPSAAQRFEDEFMKLIDNDAAVALGMVQIVSRQRRMRLRHSADQGHSLRQLNHPRRWTAERAKAKSNQPSIRPRIMRLMRLETKS